MRPIVEMRADIHQPRASLQVLAVLYFGGSRNGGPDITDEDWKQFRQDAIAFDNISMTLVIGDWHGKEELTRKVEIYGDDTTSFRHEIRSIAERYKAAFQQEAVLYSFFETHYTCDIHPMTNQAGLETYRTQNGTSGKAPEKMTAQELYDELTEDRLEDHG